MLQYNNCRQLIPIKEKTQPVPVFGGRPGRKKFKNMNESQEFQLRIFYLKKKILFPGCMINVSINPSDISGQLKKGEKILAYSIRNYFDILFCRNRTATLSEISEIETGESVKIQLKGLMRVRLKKISKKQNAFFKVMMDETGEVQETLREELRKKSQELVFLINVEESDRLINLLNFMVEPSQLTDFLANYFILDFPQRYVLYYELDVKKRSLKLITILDALIEKLKKKRESESI